jgi:hypothetical protein
MDHADGCLICVRARRSPMDHAYYCLCIRIFFATIDLFNNFDHSSYTKNYARTIYFVCYVLYYYKYFKLDLPFYIFATVFE